jgi:outer membrane lipoprotein-sorting protein
MLLVPKAPAAAQKVPKVDLWLDTAKANPVQLKVTQASGDTITLQYSNLKLNPNLSDSDLKLKLPKGVHIVTQ